MEFVIVVGILFLIITILHASYKDGKDRVNSLHEIDEE